MDVCQYNYSVSLRHCLYFGLIVHFQTFFVNMGGGGGCGAHAPCSPLDPRLVQLSGELIMV